MSLVDGQVLDGKYVITRRLAEGGMSTVFLGVNQRIGKQVAVKVLHASIAREEDVVARFEREARIVSRIRSPFVADVYDFGVLDDGARFMVMEYLEGESLATLIERDRTIPVRPLATMALQILEGLSAAHEAGIIHRDLKPENVIVTKRGRNQEKVVKLVDFGISKVVEDAGPASRRASIFPEFKATAAGAVMGTPLYMSPEQARGQTELIDQRTDLYSLGVMLYEAVAGEPPLMGENVNDLLFRVALDEPTPLLEKVPSCDPGFAAIVMKALVKDVANRWQSADAMKEAIEAWKTQFASGSQSVIPVQMPASLRTDALAVSTPMTFSPAPPAPEVIEAMRRTSTRGLIARARRYAFAVPAAAIVLMLIPAVKHAVQSHDDARPVVESSASALPVPTLLEEPTPVTPASKPQLAVAEPATVTMEPKQALPAKHVIRWTAPKAHKPVAAADRADAGSGIDALAESVATAPSTTDATPSESPNVIVAPSAEDTAPTEPQQTPEREN